MGHTLQDAIRWAVRQRNLAIQYNYRDVAAFWQSELDTLRSTVPASRMEARP